MRKFVDPKIPVYDAVLATLGDAGSSGVPDFSSTLVIVPGSLWGRKLQEALLERFPAGVCPPGILTPGGVLHFGRRDVAATWGEELVVWEEVLRNSPVTAKLFPRRADQLTGADYANAGKLLADLRRELVRGGRTLVDAAQLLSDDERWQHLVALEQEFTAKLRELGLGDPAELDRAAAADIAPLTAKFRRVIVAFVPGLPPQLRRKLALLEKEIPILVLVQGEEADADQVDDYGEPRAAASAANCLPVAPEKLHGCTDLAAAAQLVAELATSGGTVDFDPAETAIALGRPDFYFDFAENFAAAFTPRPQLFSPDGVPGRHLRIGRQLRLLYPALSQAGKADDFAAVAEYIHLEEVVKALGNKELSFSAHLTLLDDFTVEHLPDHVTDALPLMTGKYTALAELFTAVLAQLRKLSAGDFLAELKSYLATLYGKADFPPTRHILLSEEVRFWAQEIARLVHSPLMRERLLASPLAQLRYLLESTEDTVFYPAHPEAATPVYNFLEVPALRQKRLILIGINSGVIPAVAGATPFLTDSIRRKLGLIDSRRQTALEAFKLQTLLRSGREVELIVLGSAPDGSPLRPSELLYLGCNNQQLIERVTRCRQLRSAPGMPTGSAEYKLCFPDLGQQEFFTRPQWHFSVTDFKSYLASPQSFILQKIYGVDYVDYANRELTAGDFGTACHSALEKMRDCRSRNFADLRSAFFAGADEFLHRQFGTPLPLLIELQRHQIRLRLEAAAKFFAAETDPYTLLETEYSPGGRDGIRLGPLVVHGRIDRIELSPDRRTLRLIDIKTYHQIQTPEKDHWAGRGNQRRLVNLQLPLYCRLLEADREFWPKHGLVPDEVDIQVGYLLLTGEDDGVQLKQWENPEDFAAAVDQIEPTITRIAAELAAMKRDGILPPEPGSAQYYNLAPLLLNGVESGVPHE